MKKLTAQQKAFLYGVVDGLDIVEAYRRAYSCDHMSEHAIEDRAYRLAGKLNLLDHSRDAQTDNRSAGEPEEYGTANLVPYIVKDTDEAKERGAAGGRASGAARRKKASLRKAAELVLSLDCKNEKAVETMRTMGLEDQEMTNTAMITTAMMIKASRGDVKAYEALVSVIPPDEADDIEPIHIAADFGLLLGPSYLSLHRDIHVHGHTDYILKGGRGSLKSSTIAAETVKLIKEDPSRHAVVFRKVGGTLRKSVYAQFKKTINWMGLKDEFDYTVSPMEITLKATGQKIVFMGLDDTEKGRSFTPEFGYVAIMWFEEYHQYDGPEEIRTTQQSFTRGGDVFWRFKSFNPPRSKNSWVNKEAQNPDGGTLVLTTDYRTAPREWLGEQFFEDAMVLKELNEQAYRHEYLGEAIGTDGEVFQNLDIREITNDEIEGLKWIRNGVDWGFMPDPWVFVRVGYDRKTKTVYIFDEAFGRRLSDKVATDKVKEKLADEDGIFSPRLPMNMVYCDAAGKKDIATWRTLNINAVAASKWKGSPDDGIKWLQTRTRIVISTQCALAAQEFYAYEYEDDGDGGLTTYPDKNNHTIDAVRYALSTLIASRKVV